MACGQKHMVIQLGDNITQDVAEGDKIDDVLVLVQRAMNLGRHSVIVTVQAFADVAGKRDKVRALKTR